MLCRRALLAGLTGLPFEALAREQAEPRETPDKRPEDIFRVAFVPLASLSLATSRLAQERVTIPKIQEFARFEAAWQADFLDVLNTLGRSPASGSAAHPSDRSPESSLGDEERKKLAQLQATQTGTDFSRAYFVLQVSIQQNLLRMDEAFLKIGRDAQLLSAVKMADLMVREHLQLLTDIKEDADKGQITAPPGTK